MRFTFAPENMTLTHRLALISSAIIFLGSCGKPDFVHHEDLPPTMEKIYFFVRDDSTKNQISGAEIKFLNSFGEAVYEGISKPDKPWDYVGVGDIDDGFTIHDTSVEIKKAGYIDFKMDFKDIPSVEKAKNSFEVYATLKKR
jgi:hypothetical protein